MGAKHEVVLANGFCLVPGTGTAARRCRAGAGAAVSPAAGGRRRRVRPAPSGPRRRGHGRGGPSALRAAGRRRPRRGPCAGTPSRAAAARSASGDGLPVTVRRQPVTDLIIAEIARDVPSARPPAAAKKGVSDALYRAAPDQTAWQAASRWDMVNSRNQPTNTASTPAGSRDGRVSERGLDRGHDLDARRAQRPGEPVGAEYHDPLVAALGEHDDGAGRRGHHLVVWHVEAGVAQHGREVRGGAVGAVREHDVGQRRARAPSAASPTAPGSGASPWLTRSPSASVPSMSKTNPRASRSRRSTSPGARVTAVMDVLPPFNARLPVGPQGQPEPGLVHR